MPTNLTGNKYKAVRGQFLIVICLIFGFDIRESASTRRSRLLLVVCLLLNGLSIYPTIVMLVIRMGRGLSLSKLAFFTHILASYIIVVITMRIVGFDLVKLRHSLDGPPDNNWKMYIIVILFRTPIMCYFIRNVVVVILARGNIIIWLYFLSHIYRIVLGALPILIYLEAASALEKQAKSIVISLENYGSSKLDAIVKQKWLIRDKTRDLNQLFSNLLVLIYVQLSMETILATSSLVTVNLSMFARCICVVQLSTLFVVYILAYRGSKLIDALVNVERAACQRFSEIKPPNRMGRSEILKQNILQLQWQVLRFDEHWDTPTVGCFINSENTFGSFLATGFTFIAVIMQFDYKVAWVVQSLAKTYVQEDDR